MYLGGHFINIPQHFLKQGPKSSPTEKRVCRGGVDVGGPPELHLFSADIVLSSDIFQILDPNLLWPVAVAMGY